MVNEDPKKESQLSQADKWLNDAIDPSSDEQEKEEEGEQKDEDAECEK